VGADHCTRLARTWRNDREARDSYVAAAQRVERELGLEALPFDPGAVAGVDTFPALERVLLRHVEAALLEHPTPALLALAQSRLARFWADV
ncbi:hypothetical protein INQ13_24090, partial [Escherichia coli]|uniref:hypothetical protein n=1 Tax=Escherichia coli TaxID=562 RepID=UPI0019338BA2